MAAKFEIYVDKQKLFRPAMKAMEMKALPSLSPVS
jgi:hypothetical protein